MAWHDRLLRAHLEELVRRRDETADPRARPARVLEGYARIQHRHHGGEPAPGLHRGAHVARVEQQLTDLLRGVLLEGAEAGAVRSDVPPDELAAYCLHALEAARTLASEVAVARLVAVTLDGLRARSGGRP